MASLKGLLFSQYANEGLAKLVEEMQTTYTKKKGRRFNHSNITYEISRPNLIDKHIEFEISSKIPEDEVKGSEVMNKYFEKIKKILSKGKKKPASIEMENIIWDSKKESEKKRDYVKLLYRYPLDDLFNDEEIARRYEQIKKGETTYPISDVPSASTPQGKLVLLMVSENIQAMGKENVDLLMDANTQVRAALKN